MIYNAIYSHIKLFAQVVSWLFGMVNMTVRLDSHSNRLLSALCYGKTSILHGCVALTEKCKIDHMTVQKPLPLLTRLNTLQHRRAR